MISVKWRTPLLFIMTAGLICASGCANRRAADTAPPGNETAQKQSGPSPSESADISIPAFDGTAEPGEDQPAAVSDDAWGEALKGFEAEYPSLRDTAKSLDKSDFTLTDNWQGTLNGEKFSLNIYSCEAQYLLAVSKCGGSPERLRLFVSGPKSVIAFYGDSVWLMQETKGAGMPLRIADLKSDVPSGGAESLDLEFERLYAKLSSMRPADRPEGAGLSIDGYRLVIVSGLTFAIIS